MMPFRSIRADSFRGQRTRCRGSTQSIEHAAVDILGWLWRGILGVLCFEFGRQKPRGNVGGVRQVGEASSTITDHIFKWIGH